MSHAITHSSTRDDQLEYIFTNVLSNSDTIRIGCVYKPPDVKNNFDKISKIMNSSVNSDVIICGDLNINTMISQTY